MLQVKHLVKKTNANKNIDCLGYVGDYLWRMNKLEKFWVGSNTNHCQKFENSQELKEMLEKFKTMNK